MSGRVLVIEDEEIVRGLIVEVLEDAGYEVAQADRAETGLERIAADIPDVVVSDIVMPGLSGLELLERVRGSYPSLPVVLVTGAGTHANLTQALAFGASSVVVKPFAHADLIAAVQTALTQGVAAASRGRRRRSVLLVEDDADLAGLVTKALHGIADDLRVVHASDVASADKLAAESSWSLAVLDHKLPDGDGLDLLERLLDAYPQMPVLMMTGAGSERVAVEAFRRGASDYVVKGEGTLAELGTRVRALLAAS